MARWAWPRDDGLPEPAPEGAENNALSREEKECKFKRKQIQEKLIKFATRTSAFMYLTDYRENTLQDVLTKTNLTCLSRLLASRWVISTFL